MPATQIKEMTTDEVKRVIDKSDTPGRVILLTGGEPLVRKDIGEVIHYFTHHTSLEVRLNTNLLLLKKRYDEIKDCDGFFFSLDGTKETHEKNKGEGSWKGVEEGVKILHGDRRGKLSMTVITSNTTLDDIKFVLDFCAAYEILPAFQLVRHYELSKDSKKIKPDMKNAVTIFKYLLEQRNNGFKMMNSRKGLQGQIDLVTNTLKAKCYSGKLLCTVDADGIVGLCFSRPRFNQSLNLVDDKVTFKDALARLYKIKSHTNRCSDCTCMAPIEFSLCNPYNIDVLYDNYISERAFRKNEEEYIRNNRKFCL